MRKDSRTLDQLDANCISWRIFEDDDFPVSFAMKGMNLNALQGRFNNFDDGVRGEQAALA